MRDTKLKFTIEPFDDDLELEDFSRKIENFLAILRENTKTLTGDSENVHWVITELSKNSPAYIEVHPYSKVKNIPQEIVQSIPRHTIQWAKEVYQGRKKKNGMSKKAYNLYQELIEYQEYNVKKVTLSNDEDSIGFMTKTKNISVKEENLSEMTEEGSFTGWLEQVNIHGDYSFVIYPIAGPSKIRCIFQSDLLPAVAEAIKKRANTNVIGTLKYHANCFFPHTIEVKEMEIYPSDNQLPRLFELRGIAPDATGKLDSVAFIRKLRDAET